MRKLKVVKNHKDAFYADKSKRKKEKSFMTCYLQHTKSSLNKAFVNPILFVNISTGEILADRITQRYSEYY